MKRLAAVVLSVCLAVPMFSMVASAAEGTLMFSDPETKVGENVKVDLVVRTGGEAIGDADVTMSYDTGSLEFVSGEGVEADGSGKLTYSGSGDGSESELRTTMEFRALKSGDASITVDSSTAYLYSDETLNLDEGSSAIKIAAADDGSTTAEATGETGTEGTSGTAGTVTDIVVNVNGTDYNFSEAFTTADIPAGYSETTMAFNGEDRKFVANDAGVYLGFLVDASGMGSFFLYNEENATFLPYVEISVSDSTSIILLNDTAAVSLPGTYQETELTVADQIFPTWSDPSNDRYYIVYALNTRTGEKGLYQYDREDGTYQTFEAPAAESEDTHSSSLIGKIGDFMGGHALIVLIAGAAIVLLLLILMIVFAVKLVHRNQELDDLYDEYDIPMDDEDDDQPAVQKKSRKQFVGYEDEDDEYEDDEYEEDEDDEYGYDDEYEDDEYEEYEDDDDEDIRSGNTKNIRKSKRSSGKEEEDYEIDFIDL